MRIHGYNVKFSSDKRMGGYEGMNHYAAKALGFRPVPGKKTIIIDALYKGRKRTEVEKHEIKEANLMAKGWHYFPAHLHAERAEKRRWKDV